MKKLSVFLKVFLVIGILLLGGALYWFFNIRNFQDAALKADGTVVQLQRHVSTSSNRGSSVTYKPVVRFSTSDGKQYEYISSTSSNPPSFSVGEKVTVLYNPSNPNDAQIGGMNAYWGPLIVGFMGLIFGLVGGIPLYLQRKRKRRNERLLTTGEKIISKIVFVGPNTSIRINGRHPFQISSQWHDTPQNKVYTFKSDPIGFNPEPFLDGRDTIDVFIEPRNPKKYIVDIRFLPEKG